MTLAGSALELLLLASWLGALVTVPSVLLQRAGRPTAALSWLLALFAVPAVALVAWWLFGRTHLRRRSLRRRRASERIARSLSRTERRLRQAAAGVATPVSRLAPHLPPRLQEGAFPATAGNRVELLVDPAAVHRAWADLVAGARHHLHLLFYIWRDDATGRALRDRLAAQARRGVEVRVLYDAVGSWGLPRGFFAPLEAAGGRAAPFMPVRLLVASPTVNFRNHRKLLIADGRRACTGGINVGDEYLDWYDLGLWFHGPGVNQLQEVFVDDWHFTTGEELTGGAYFCEPSGSDRCDLPGRAVCETITSGPDQPFNATREMVFLAITQCRRRLWIATPYFVPDAALMLALRTAVYRGVDVRLVLPERSDSPLVRRASRVFYRPLLEGGVRVFEYPGMLHAKAMVLDGDGVLVGSANLDNRSFRLNFELSTYVVDRTLNGELSARLAALQDPSRELDLGHLRRDSHWRRLHDSLAHLLSPLL